MITIMLAMLLDVTARSTIGPASLTLSLTMQLESVQELSMSIEDQAHGVTVTTIEYVSTGHEAITRRVVLLDGERLELAALGDGLELSPDREAVAWLPK